MEFRTLEITSMDAKDLKSVNLMSRMDVYAVVSISGDPRTARRTPVDKDGGRNPYWKNLSLRFNVPVPAASQPNYLTLNFVLKSDRVFGDRDVGEVNVPIKELLENSGGSVTYQVRAKSGRTQGTLSFSYKVGEKFSAPVAPSAPKSSGEPVMAYPPPPGANHAYPPPVAYPPQYPPHAGSGYGYAPPSSGYGYPQQPPYGYAQPAGYGYPPPAQKKKNSKFGLGLGAGLLGGLLVGEMASDIGEMAAYDAGYEDGLDGGFDF